MKEFQCPTCGEEFAVSLAMVDEIRNGSRAFCPRGHELYFQTNYSRLSKDEQVALLERMWA